MYLLLRRSIQTLLARVRQPEKIVPPWGWPLGIGLAAAYLIVFFVSLLLTTNSSDVAFNENPEPGVLAWAHLIACLLTTILIYQYVSSAFYKAQDNKQISIKLRLAEALHLTHSENTPLGFVALFAFSIAIIADVVGSILGAPFESLPRPLSDLSIEENLGQFVIGVLVVVAARPLVEELIFRGILYPGLLKQFAPIQAVGISALVFTAVHFLLDSHWWWGLGYPLTLGITAGLARGATKSTQAAIITHMMFGIFIMLRAIIL